jgi:hypothetical protein
MKQDSDRIKLAENDSISQQFSKRTLLQSYFKPTGLLQELLSKNSLGRQFPSTDFMLEHDGHAVISVRPARKNAAAAYDKLVR